MRILCLKMFQSFLWERLHHHMYFTALFGAMVIADARTCTDHPWHTQFVNDIIRLGTTSTGVQCADNMAREPWLLLHDR